MKPSCKTVTSCGVFSRTKTKKALENQAIVGEVHHSLAIGNEEKNNLRKIDKIDVKDFNLKACAASLSDNIEDTTEYINKSCCSHTKPPVCCEEKNYLEKIDARKIDKSFDPHQLCSSNSNSSTSNNNHNVGNNNTRFTNTQQQQQKETDKSEIDRFCHEANGSSSSSSSCNNIGNNNTRFLQPPSCSNCSNSSSSSSNNIGNNNTRFTNTQQQQQAEKDKSKIDRFCHEANGSSCNNSSSNNNIGNNNTRFTNTQQQQQAEKDKSKIDIFCHDANASSYSNSSNSNSSNSNSSNSKGNYNTSITNIQPQHQKEKDKSEIEGKEGLSIENLNLIKIILLDESKNLQQILDTKEKIKSYKEQRNKSTRILYAELKSEEAKAKHKELDTSLWARRSTLVELIQLSRRLLQTAEKLYRKFLLDQQCGKKEKDQTDRSETAILDPTSTENKEGKEEGSVSDPLRKSGEEKGAKKAKDQTDRSEATVLDPTPTQNKEDKGEGSVSDPQRKSGEEEVTKEAKDQTDRSEAAVLDPTPTQNKEGQEEGSVLDTQRKSGEEEVAKEAKDQTDRSEAAVLDATSTQNKEGNKEGSVSDPLRKSGEEKTAKKEKDQTDRSEAAVLDPTPTQNKEGKEEGSVSDPLRKSGEEKAAKKEKDQTCRSQDAVSELEKRTAEKTPKEEEVDQNGRSQDAVLDLEKRTAEETPKEEEVDQNGRSQDAEVPEDSLEKSEPHNEEVDYEEVAAEFSSEDDSILSFDLSSSKCSSPYPQNIPNNSISSQDPAETSIEIIHKSINTANGNNEHKENSTIPLVEAVEMLERVSFNKIKINILVNEVNKKLVTLLSAGYKTQDFISIAEGMIWEKESDLEEFLDWILEYCPDSEQEHENEIDETEEEEENIEEDVEETEYDEKVNLGEFLDWMTGDYHTALCYPDPEQEHETKGDETEEEKEKIEEDIVKTKDEEEIEEERKAACHKLLEKYTNIFKDNKTVSNNESNIDMKIQDNDDKEAQNKTASCNNSRTNIDTGNTNLIPACIIEATSDDTVITTGKIIIKIDISQPTSMISSKLVDFLKQHCFRKNQPNLANIKLNIASVHGSLNMHWQFKLTNELENDSQWCDCILGSDFLSKNNRSPIEKIEFEEDLLVLQLKDGNNYKIPANLVKKE